MTRIVQIVVSLFVVVTLHDATTSLHDTLNTLNDTFATINDVND